MIPIMRLYGDDMVWWWYGVAWDAIMYDDDDDMIWHVMIIENWYIHWYPLIEKEKKKTFEQKDTTPNEWVLIWLSYTKNFFLSNNVRLWEHLSSIDCHTQPKNTKKTQKKTVSSFFISHHLLIEIWCTLYICLGSMGGCTNSHSVPRHLSSYPIPLWRATSSKKTHSHTTR